MTLNERIHMLLMQHGPIRADALRSHLPPGLKRETLYGTLIALEAQQQARVRPDSTGHGRPQWEATA